MNRMGRRHDTWSEHTAPRGTVCPRTRNPPHRPGQADLASFQHVERLAYARSASTTRGCSHNHLSMLVFSLFVRSKLMEVFVSNVKKSWRLCVHFSANA